MLESHILDSDTADTIKYLHEKGYKLGIISNNIDEDVRYIINREGIGDLFETVVCSSTVGERKPSAKIFLVMPILIPLCHAIGISSNLLIFIYCIADGFSDVIIPTNPVLLIGLSMSNVSYGKWVKWTWKIQLLILLVSVLLIFFGVYIKY